MEVQRQTCKTVYLPYFYHSVCQRTPSASKVYSPVHSMAAAAGSTPIFLKPFNHFMEFLFNGTEAGWIAAKGPGRV